MRKRICAHEEWKYQNTRTLKNSNDMFKTRNCIAETSNVVHNIVLTHLEH